MPEVALDPNLQRMLDEQRRSLQQGSAGLVTNPFNALGRPFIGADFQTDQRQREQGRAAANAGDLAGLQRQQQELQDLMAAATRRRIDADWLQAEFGGTGGRPPIETNLAALGKGIEAKGTFSAFAISGLGASSVTDRMARSLENIDRNTRDNAQPAFT